MLVRLDEVMKLLYTLTVAALLGSYAVVADEVDTEVYALCEKLRASENVNVSRCVKAQYNAFIKVQSYLNDIEVFSGNIMDTEGYSYDGLLYFECLDGAMDVDGYINYVDFNGCLER